MTPEAQVRFDGTPHTTDVRWTLTIGPIFVASTNNANQADLYQRIADVWNNHEETP